MVHTSVLGIDWFTILSHVCLLVSLNSFFVFLFFFFFQAEDGIRDIGVTGVQTCALPIWLINETYSAFVQGFMPTLARPEVDVLDGLTTAIIVDQERMGANPRSTVGTATDANAMLRILFSRLGEPHIGPPSAYSFNTPSVRASGAITVERGAKTKSEKATFTRLGGMCPRCEGMGSVNDIDLTALYDDSKSLIEGALTIPGYSMDGWYGRLFQGAGLDMDKPIRGYSAKEMRTLLHEEPTKIRVEGINLTYEGITPRTQKSMLSKEVDGMQPHVRRFVIRAVP